MTKSATRRAVLAGWLGRVFSQGAQTNFKSLHHKPRVSAEFGAGPLFSGTLMPKGLQIFKQTDLLRAIRTFQKAGLSIARAEIDRDGKIVLVTGNNSEQPEQSDNIVL